MRLRTRGGLPARLALLHVLAAGVACAPEVSREPAPPAPPEMNVIVILVDCLRAGHMGAYGYERSTTPNMDRLAAESVLFEHAVAASNWTKPSVASLFTGAWVSQHLLTEGHVAAGEGGPMRSQVLAPELVTLAELASEAGMATGGFVNQGHLAEYMGFAQGFDRYRTGLDDHGVVEAFAGWLTGARGRPFFAYLHLVDLHFPYTPQEHIDRFNDEIQPRRMKALIREDGAGFRARVAAGELSDADRREVRGLYDGELLGVDDTVRKALDVLRVNDLYDDTLVVLTSDHGEALFEHGAFEHGGDLMWEPVLHVPLLIKLPGGRHGGRRVPGPVGLVDVLPTIAVALGATPPPGIGGRALLSPGPDGTLEAMRPADHLALAEPTVAGAPRALYLDTYKFLFPPGATNPSSVYDLGADPGEENDLVAGLDPALLARAQQRLYEIEVAASEFSRNLEVSEADLRPEELEKLRALGYIQ